MEGAGAFQFKSYDYKSGENIVLELSESVRKSLSYSKSEGDGGKVESLRGIIKMSDFGSRITSRSASYEKHLERSRRREARAAKLKRKEEAIKRLQIYVPQTTETARAYEEFVAIISDLVGGVPDDVLHETAFEILKALRRDGSDQEKVQQISDILGMSPNSETISRIFGLSSELTDFTVDAQVSIREADEDGIISITQEGVGELDDITSSSSDDEPEIEPVVVADGSSSGGGGWSMARLTEMLEGEFGDEARGKLDLVMQILRSESGTRLETELARVIGFNKPDVVKSVVLNKDAIIGKDEENKGMETLDFSDFVFEQCGRFLALDNVVLPKNTETTDEEFYREVFVPFENPPTSSERLVSINELPESAQAAFSGFRSLNRIQSTVYESAMKKDVNLLVAAPTGAGKTNIALMCILREFEMRPGAKIVYVAPMKSLVQEMVGSFSYRLSSYGKVVVELTGDSSASKGQLEKSDIIVTTPEKWDIITRKVGSRVLTEKVSLVIVDEVHLLHDERGPVLEALITRLKRIMDTTKQHIRIVGLSATMPNYEDIAVFLRALDGMFVFDERYRPCPLHKRFIGVRNKSGLAAKREMNDICFRKIMERVETSQVLVFVHSRRETVDTVNCFIEKARDAGVLDMFASTNTRTADILLDSAERSHNSDLKSLLPSGFAFHNAGLDADDRKLVESLFAKGHVKVLISTATLAWGVNLPAHTVIIKGTRIYSPERSQWESLSHLDVLQMFGRAGRPQYDTFGEGIIITEIAELKYYVSVLNQQLPIESHFLRSVTGHLNAEIAMGTITNIKDAAAWIGYTYLYVRMLKAPKLYKIESSDDSSLMKRRMAIVHTAALELHEKRLIIYDQKTGDLKATSLGRIASDFYVSPETMDKFSQFLRPYMTDVDLFRLFCVATEFKHVSVRPEEKGEVAKLISLVPIPVREQPDEATAKINVLLQCYICRLQLHGFSLMADMIYISQNAERIFRCLFEIAVSSGWAELSLSLLSICKMVGRRMWSVQSPLRQFRNVPAMVIAQLERKYVPWGSYFDLSPSRLGEMARSPKDGEFLAATVRKFPRIKVSGRALPLTPTLLKMNLDITAMYDYDPEVHFTTEPFWVFACDGAQERLLYSELVLLKAQHPNVSISFVVTLLEPTQPFYTIKVISDRWIPCEAEIHVPLMNMTKPPAISQRNFVKPSGSANPFEQVVRVAESEPTKSVVIAAPVNSGRGNCVRAIVESARRIGQRVVIVVPVFDKFDRIAQEYEQLFGFARLSGDPERDMSLISGDMCIVGTYSMFVNVPVCDTVVLFDVHLASDDRFADYEVLIANMLISQSVGRFILVSASVADPRALGAWIKTDQKYVFGFSPQMRNIAFQIQTFNFPTAKARSMAMAMPTFTAVKDARTSIIFVPTISQMYATAFDLVSFASIDGNQNMFCRGSPATYTNSSLQELSQYGVALYHPSLCAKDKQSVVNSFGCSHGCIVALLDTVWELNLSADVIVMKGTDVYDGTTHNHVEYPIYLVLEAMGLTLDNGRFVLFTSTHCKQFYLSLLTEPLPIESSFDLVAQMAFNNACCSGLAPTKEKLVAYIVRTFYYQRIVRNPTYYGLPSGTKEAVSDFVSDLIDSVIEELQRMHACQEHDDAFTLSPLPLGQIACNRFVDPATTSFISEMIRSDMGHRQLLQLICACTEFQGLPIRSPKAMAAAMSQFPESSFEPDNPSSCCVFIFTCHMGRARHLLPEDLAESFRTMCVFFLRIASAIIDIAAAQGWLIPTVAAIQLIQRIVQSVPLGGSELLQLPFVDREIVERCEAASIKTVDALRDAGSEENGEIVCKRLLGVEDDERKWLEICEGVNRIPSVMLEARRVDSSSIIVVLDRDMDDDEVVGDVVGFDFPIRKKEAWYLIVSDESKEVLAIKKISFERHNETVFTVGDTGKPLKVFAMCDSYIGCDRACDVK